VNRDSQVSDCLTLFFGKCSVRVMKETDLFVVGVVGCAAEGAECWWLIRFKCIYFWMTFAYSRTRIEKILRRRLRREWNKHEFELYVLRRR